LIIVGNCRVHEIQLGSADGQAQFKVRRNVDASSMFRHLQRAIHICIMMQELHNAGQSDFDFAIARTYGSKRY
jgi:hypothetical protein